MGLVAPVGIVAFQDHVRAARVVRKLVRAGADRFRGLVEIGRFRRRAEVVAAAGRPFHALAAVSRGGQDAESRHAVRQERHRVRGLEHDGQRVGRLDGLEAAGVDREGRRRVLHLRDAAERIDHVLRREIGAARELYARAQLELPGLVVDGPPGGGELGHELLRLVGRGERLEDVASHVVVGTHIVEMRVDRRDLGRDADLQFLRRRRSCRNKNQARPSERRNCMFHLFSSGLPADVVSALSTYSTMFGTGTQVTSLALIRAIRNIRCMHCQPSFV